MKIIFYNNSGILYFELKYSQCLLTCSHVETRPEFFSPPPPPADLSKSPLVSINRLPTEVSTRRKEEMKNFQNESLDKDRISFNIIDELTNFSELTTGKFNNLLIGEIGKFISFSVNNFMFYLNLESFVSTKSVSDKDFVIFLSLYISMTIIAGDNVQHQEH